MELLGMDRSFTSRAVNEGFSGGEKKRTEILQLAMLEPKYAVLDETDSGLGIDALKTVSHGGNSLRGPDLGILLITHYQRLLNYIIPDYVHVMVGGRIVRSGRKELALELEERGYDWAREGAAESAFTRKQNEKRNYSHRYRSREGRFLLPRSSRARCGSGLERAHDSLHRGCEGGSGLGARFSSARFEDILGETAPHALGKQGTRGH